VERQALEALVRRALDEDIGSGDVTTAATVAPGTQAVARITQKSPGVVYGMDVAAAAFRAVDAALVLTQTGPEGVWREGGPVMEISGSARSLLVAERTALNFLQQLSGVATLTARCVQAVAGTGARILDTRKTVPGLRLLQKQAVLAGGGVVYRLGLYDAILIKENHAALAGGVGAAVRLARTHAPALPLEVECGTLAEVDEALAAAAEVGLVPARGVSPEPGASSPTTPPDSASPEPGASSPMTPPGSASPPQRPWSGFRILLDNMSPRQLREAVEFVAGRAELEASGGFTLETIREVAETGVDFISVGALTHSATALDLSLLLEPLP
jgi:nicotinate-nucleotide pyrophosphorylase (carboxylating)